MKKLRKIIPLLALMVTSHWANNASAAILQPATGGTAIPANTAGGTWTALSGPVYAETSGGDFNIPGGGGTFILNAPAGFEFDTTVGLRPYITITGASQANKNINSTPSGGTITNSSMNGSSVTFSITSKSSSANILNFNNIRVRPTSATPTSPAVAKITSGGTVTAASVTAGTTSWGDLVSVGVDQTISFDPLDNKTYGDADFDISATASSGLTVSFAVTSGNTFATVVGNTVHITGAGTVTIEATQAGNGTYNAATPVSQNLVIDKATAAISVTGYSVTYDSDPHTATAIATGALGEDLSGLVDLSGTTHTAAGSYLADPWTFPGDANHDPANGTVDDAIAKANAFISVSGFTGSYDGNPHGASGSATGVGTDGDLSGLLNFPDAFTDVPGGTANWTFAGNGNYNAAGGTVGVTINPLGLTGSFTANNKVYDGTDAATISGRSLNGFVPSDLGNITLDDGTATFSDANVGSGKTVTGTGFTLGGSAAGNYSLTSVDTTTADITALSISGSFTASNKVYDGNDSASISAPSLTGVLGVDDGNVTLDGGSATFSDANVGTGKTVTGTGFTLGGSAAGNYSLGSVATTSADITPLGIVGSFTADNKVYDGTDAATITGRSLTGVLPADDGNVTLDGGTATFSDPNVGTDKTVTGTGFTLGGTAAGNYEISSVDTVLASILEFGLTVTFTADNKVYDGTTAAVINGSSLSGVIGADDVNVTGGTATFSDANVGTGKTVTGSGFTLTGTAAANYAIGTINTALADITALGITGSFTADNKVYDGTDAATITGSSLTGVLAADDGNVTLDGGTATFSDANAGPGKTVTGTGFTLGGTAAGNYSLTSVDTTTADITALSIDGVVTVADKLFDGNTSASIDGRSLTGVIGADDVSLVGGTATFDTADRGEDKQVTVTGLSITGADAGNYTLASSTVMTTASILNNNPTAFDVGFGRKPTSNLSMSVERILLLASDVDGDTVTLQSVDALSANGAEIVIVGDLVLYVYSGHQEADSFGYTVSDGHGGTDTKTVFVTINPDSNGPGNNLISTTPVGDDVIVKFAGVPGRTYHIQRTTSLTPPIVWSNRGDATANGTGIVEFTDVGGASVSGFYRTVYP